MFQVQIFNPFSNEVHKSFTKFREAAHGGRFRSDGQLLSVGSDDGKVRVLSVATKTLLRTFEGHENATHRSEFLSDGKAVVSFSDDKTVRIWDLATGSETHKFAEHKVRTWPTFFRLWVKGRHYVNSFPDNSYHNPT